MNLAHLPALAVFLACTVSLSAATPPGKTQQITSPDQVPEGLEKSDWHSIRAAYEAGRHAFKPIEGGWQARNPGQQWTTKFDGRGFVAEPRDGGWQWGLELKGYGFPGAERVVNGVPAVKAEGQRLTYGWDAAAAAPKTRTAARPASIAPPTIPAPAAGRTTPARPSSSCAAAGRLGRSRPVFRLKVSEPRERGTILASM